MNYIIYCRKSSESADRQILSIDAQERELLELAKKDDLSVIRVFKESMSAKDEGRPVFAEMIEFIKKGKAQGVLTWKIDRLARNLVEGGAVIDLLQRGIIQIIRTHDRTCLPSDNVLMLAVEFGMANQYVRDLSVNVKRGLREKLSRGEWYNRAPLGYLNDQTNKTLIIDPEKAKYVLRAFEMYASGTHGYVSISDTLYDEGLRTNAGGKVYSGHIHRMLGNPLYMGILEREGKYYKGNHKSIVSNTLFSAVRRVAEEECHPRPKTLFFPLRGFLKCAVCGCMLTATKKKGHDYYYCTNGKEMCEEHKTYMREQYLYPLVGSILDNLHMDEELIEIMYQAALERAKSNFTYSESILKTLQTSLDSLKTKEKRLLDSYLEGQIEKELYEAKILDLKNERVTLERQIAETKQKDTLPEFTLEPVKNVFLRASRAKKEFLEADENKKHKILENLLWNLSFKNKNIVSYQFKKEFEMIAKSPKKGDFVMLLGG